jgi:aldehyde:ferredoxin oxidoreductase
VEFDAMKRDYWEQMGWDGQGGRPLPETLADLGLADLIPDLWSDGETR